MAFSYDYSKTMMMKLFMAKPDGKGGSAVFCDFAKALEIIKAVDNLTVGAPKIIYLVGWQYMGHDDKYPAFFEVNPFLKRPEDETALDSLLYVMTEAKKYHTVVSLHINFADAYVNSPIFPYYKINKALIRTKYGREAKIEKYNGLDCYKVSYKEEWLSGLFVRRVNRLLTMIPPLKSAGTIHVDNFQCYLNSNPKVSVYEMQVYRKKMVDYLAEKGIDITTEFTYREGPLTGIAYGSLVRDVLTTRYPVDLLGKIPAVWWVDKLTGEEIMRYYPHVYGGGMLKNEKYAAALYGNIHGEDIWRNNPDNWTEEFAKQFACINVPFFYLNSKLKKSYNEDRNGVTVEYTDGTVSEGKSKKIRIGGKILKNKNTLCLPVYWQENGYAAYTEYDGEAELYVAGREASVSLVTPSGLEFLSKEAIRDGKIIIEAKASSLYFIRTSN